MNNDFKNAVKGWLEAIMPSVAATIADVLTPEALRECARKRLSMVLIPSILMNLMALSKRLRFMLW